MLFYIIGFLVIAGFGLVILKIRNRVLLNIEQAEKSGLVRNVNDNNDLYSSMDSVNKSNLFSSDSHSCVSLDLRDRINYTNIHHNH